VKLCSVEFVDSL